MSHDFDFNFPAISVTDIKLEYATLVTENFGTMENFEEKMEDENDIDVIENENDMTEHFDELDDSEEGFKEGIRSWQRRFNKRSSRRFNKTFGIKKKSKKKNKTKYYNNYYYLSANLDNQNGSSHLFTNNMHFTLGNLYIVGNDKMSGANATLIISYKSINDHNNESSIVILYMFIPLNINQNTNNKNVITTLLDSAYKKEPLTSAIDFKPLLESSLKEGFTNFSYFNYIPNSGITSMDIFVFPKIVNVYFSQKFKWITSEVQNKLRISKPISLNTLKDAQNTKKKTVSGTLNKSLSKEEKIYIQCAPAGASQKTEMVQIDARRKKEKHNLSFIIIASLVVVMNILIIGMGYQTIYLLLSAFFVKNVIEDGRHKRRNSPLEMFLYWIADLFPHIVEMQWNGNKRTSSENLIRVFVYGFYAFLVVMILYSIKSRNMNLLYLAIYIIFIYISDIFFFFIQIRNMNAESYDALKDSKFDA